MDLDIPLTKSGSERFLDAFAAIEWLLRKQCSADRTTGFLFVVESAARNDKAVANFRDDLKEYAELRNAIVHERIGGQAIAEPHLRTVEHLEAILAKLTDPPRLESLFLRRVLCTLPQEPIGQAARSMLEHNFSQLPVYSEQTFVGLLTAETIARWLAAQRGDGFVLLEDVAVEEVLAHTEDPESHTFRSRTDTAFEALADFERFERRGKSLHAILITHAGISQQTPIGIVSVADIPRLIASVEPRQTPGPRGHESKAGPLGGRGASPTRTEARSSRA